MAARVAWPSRVRLQRTTRYAAEGSECPSPWQLNAGARAERIGAIVPVHAPIPPALRSASGVDYRTRTKENRHQNE